MKYFIAFVILAALQCVSAQLLNQQTFIPPVVTYGDGTISCPSQEQRESTHQTLDTVANALTTEPVTNALATEPVTNALATEPASTSMWSRTVNLSSLPQYE